MAVPQAFTDLPDPGATPPPKPPRKNKPTTSRTEKPPPKPAPRKRKQGRPRKQKMDKPVKVPAPAPELALANEKDTPAMPTRGRQAAVKARQMLSRLAKSGSVQEGT